MVFALLTLLAAATSEGPPASIAQMTAQECPAPSFDKERGYLGDRAIIADDGSKMVVQCGDGVIRFWQSGSAAFKPVGKVPLFRAAQENGVIPAGVLCPWSSLIRNNMKIDADCDVVGHSDAGGVYILQTPGSPDSFVVSGPKVLQESTVWQRFGAFPVKGTSPNEIYIVDGQKRPELLQKLSLNNGRVFTIARLPSPNLLFEDGEGDASSVSYSPIYRSIIVSFGGAFRVAEEMTYLRALDESGKERWSIKGKLPSRDEGLIVGDFTRTMMFADGRYALLAKTSDRHVAQIIDLANGDATATIRGWPIAAARNAAMAFVKVEQGTLSLIRLEIPDRSAEQSTAP